MCYVVYLGTDLKLDPILWNDKKPAFNFQEVLDNENNKVRAQFSKTNVYYVGSHEGCGCGFAYDGTWDTSDPEDVEDNLLRKESVAQFNQLLKEILARTNGCEIFLCWDGDEGDTPQRIETVGANFFSEGDWVEDEPTLYRVINNSGDT